MLLVDCPVRTTIDVLDGKWKPLILASLKSGKRRYGQLRTQMKEPSEKVLVEQLRQLAEDGIIERISTAGNLPQVVYGLTPYGQTLMPLLQLMADWGTEHRRRSRSLGSDCSNELMLPDRTS